MKQGDWFRVAGLPSEYIRTENLGRPIAGGFYAVNLETGVSTTFDDTDGPFVVLKKREKE